MQSIYNECAIKQQAQETANDINKYEEEQLELQLQNFYVSSKSNYTLKPYYIYLSVYNIFALL